MVSLAITNQSFTLLKEIHSPGSAGSDEFGVQVAGVDDKDADGVDDFWVSATKAGKLYLMNKYGKVLAEVNNPAPGVPGNFGWSLTATEDLDGKRGYVLTLQAREQHIRREKATSNICSNESLCALRSVIYLSLIGKEGLIELAGLIHDKAEFMKDAIDKIQGVEVERNSPTFNEFTVALPMPADEVIGKMIHKGFAAGFPLGRYYEGMDNHLLVAVTERRTKEDIMKYVESLEAVLCI